MIDLSILYVDNDEQALASFSEFYSTEYNIDTAASIKQALIKLNKSYFDIVFSEYNLTSMNGIEFLRILTQDFPTIPVVLVTNQPSETLCREAFLAGATDVIDKISGITKNKLAFNAIIEKSLKTKTPVVSKDSGDNYFQLANSLPVGLILVEERAVCFANRAAMDFLGFDNLDELVGRALIDFIHKDHRLEVFNIYEQLKRPGKKIKPRIHKWIDATGNPSQVKVNMSSVALQGKVLIQFIFEQLTGQQMMGILSDRLSRLSKDYEKNLNLLVSAVGELCGADLAVYQKVEEGKMVALGKWNTPDGFVDSIDYARCIGSEVVRQGLEAEDLVVLNVGCTKFIRTDLNLKNADFRKLIGAPVFLFNNVVGALSLFLERNKAVDDNIRRIFSIVASMLGKEEERIQLKEALKKSERKYRNFADFMPVSIVDLDWKGNIITINETATNEFGFTRNDVSSGLHIFQFFNTNEHLQLKRDLKDMATGKIHKETYEARAKEGKTFTCITSFHPVIKDETIAFIRAMIIDISSQNELMQKPGEEKTSGKSIDVIFNVLSEGAVITDLEGNIFQINSRALTHFSSNNIDELTGRNFREFIHPRHHQKYEETIRQVMRTREGKTIVCKMQPPLCEREKCRIRVSIFKDKAGVPLGLIHIVEDVVPDHDSQVGIIFRSGVLDFIFENTTDMIFTKDTDYKYTRVSPAMESISGISSKIMEGKTDNELFSEPLARKMLETDLQALNGETVKLEFELDEKGRRKSFTVVKAPCFDNYDKIKGILGIITDNTSRDILKNELKKKNRYLRDLECSLNNDLMNNINLLRGYFNLVKEDPRLLGTNYPRIVNSLDRLNTYVNTLLEFSSAGEIERDAKLNLDSFLNNVLSKINTENADVRVQVEPDLEIMASAHSLEQAFTLLFKNTLSRAPESGKVSLIIAGRREDDRIIIQITDNGKQMHLKKPEDIFSLCASLKSEKHLTGLPVCSRIIEAHEGTIKMISLRKRRLTQFLITFPA